MADIDRHVEVVSSASVSRTIESYRAQINITVTTRKKQSCLDESLALRDQVLDAVSNAGIEGNDIEECGGQLAQSSWSSSKTVTHRLQVSHTEMTVIMQAMANVERLFAGLKQGWFTGIRKDFTFNVPTIQFSEDPDAAEKALTRAIAIAKRKASFLAQEAGLQLGRVLSIIEERRIQSQPQYNQHFGVADDLLDDDYDLSFAESTTVNYLPAAPRQGTSRVFFRVRFAIEERVE